jgi:hypothetical protein
MRRLTSTISLLILAAAVGCKDQLVVENVNNPDRDRALARPTDVENLVAGQFRVLNNAMWSTGGIQPQLGVMGMESFSTNANFGMGVRSGVPRALVDNSRGNPADTYTTWLALNQAARAEALALSKLNQLSFTFFPASEAQRQRDRAFAYFAMGMAQGWVAMMFDSGPVITPNDDLEAPNLMVGYDSLMRVALVALDTAIAAAKLTPAGANGFPIPNSTAWIPTPAAFSLTGGAAGNFVRLVRSYQARFRAGVARTPAERGAVNWAAVIADAQNGVTADFQVIMNNVSGGWFYNPMQASTFQSWHQEWQLMVGMADTSGGYDTWLGTARQNKVPFVVLTRDTRFPTGLTRPAQNAASGCTTGTTCVPPAGNYFRNRLAGQDVAVDGLFFSYYDFQRFQAYFDANQNGTLPQIARSELDLLMAEGYIRTGNFPLAMTQINISRGAHGLPALVGFATINDLIPGTGCIPRVPVGVRSAAPDTPTATACGNIMEAMKWEKRLETAFISPGAWYFDARGWGDLPFNTPVQFPVPYTELDSRGEAIYSVPTTVAGAILGTAVERLTNSSSNYGLGTP